LAGYEQAGQDLAALDIKVYAASVDDADKAAEIAADLSFPVAHGVTREDADRLGAWWGEPRNIIQPSEFVVGADGKVVSSTYSSGPIGRVDAADVAKLINFYEERARKGA
jgi:peroxiredoxin